MDAGAGLTHEREHSPLREGQVVDVFPERPGGDGDTTPDDPLDRIDHSLVWFHAPSRAAHPT
jgi:hypothetical protein